MNRMQRRFVEKNEQKVVSVIIETFVQLPEDDFNMVISKIKEEREKRKKQNNGNLFY